MELIERALLGGVGTAYGTDLDARALEVARANFSAATLSSTEANLIQIDFRDVFRDQLIKEGSISLIISNPPLGRRVRVKDLRGLFGDFFAVASRGLKPDGLLIFTNPLQMGPNDPSLTLEYSQTVDLGGFNCQLEMYRKAG